MLSITKIHSAGTQRSAGWSNINYHEYLDIPRMSNQSDFADYVLGKELEGPPPFWIGRGVEALGLSEHVAADQVDRLARGFHPLTGAPLFKTAGDNHVMGLDMTLSPPKDVSAVFAGADATLQREIIRSVQLAAAVALQYAQTGALTRHSAGGREKQRADATLAACYFHFASRENDPQLHVHGFFFNLGKRAGVNEWSGLETRPVFERKMAAGILFRVELAAQMRALGFTVEPTPDGYFTINGITDAQRSALSTRSHQIADYLAAKAATERSAGDAPATDADARPDARAKGRAALQTRSAKAEPPLAELLGLFRSKASALGITPDSVKAMRAAPTLKPAASATGQSGGVDHFAIDQETLLAELTREKSCIAPSDALLIICRMAMGRWDAQECLAHLDRTLTSEHVIHLGATEMLTPVLTTQTTVHQEQSISARVSENAACRDHALATTLLDKHFYALEAELSSQVGVPVVLNQQRAAAHHIGCETGRHAFVEGWAGTGKTTLLKAVSDAYKEAGFSVVGCAQSAAAALNLGRETGVRSGTIARLLLTLGRGKNRITDRTVLILDEAGMVGSSEFATLQEAVLKHGAKLVCVGDQKQLQPVEGGGIFASLVREHGKAELSNIQRQKTDFAPLLDWLDQQALLGHGLTASQTQALRRLPEECKLAAVEQLCQRDERLKIGFTDWRARFDYAWSREAVKQLATGNALEALTTLDAKGKLHTAANATAAREAIVASWLNDPTPLLQKTMIAATRLEVAELNALARRSQIERHAVNDAQGLDLLIEQRDESLSLRRFAPGDRIVFTKNDDRLGVVNGATGTLRAFRTPASKPFSMPSHSSPSGSSTSMELTASVATAAPATLADQPQATLIVELDEPNANGRTHLFIPAAFARFDLAYCLTNHKSQGRTFDSAHVLLNPNVAGREWAYVAASRSRFSTDLFVDESALLAEASEFVSVASGEAPTLSRPDMVKALAARLAPSRAKGTTLDYAAAASEARAEMAHEATPRRQQKSSEATPAMPDAKLTVMPTPSITLPSETVTQPQAGFSRTSVMSFFEGWAQNKVESLLARVVAIARQSRGLLDNLRTEREATAVVWAAPLRSAVESVDRMKNDLGKRHLEPSRQRDGLPVMSDLAQSYGPSASQPPVVVSEGCFSKTPQPAQGPPPVATLILRR
ncbi:MobF family relaxase [Robbsia sp. KACC 23696]|uniref:MobF family relaxase n=1 Tax=Robbsia sp. KACC 23696 TaxID=3149231 RepID=UPI00325C25D3